MDMKLLSTFPIRYKLTLIVMLMCVSMLILISIALFSYDRMQDRRTLITDIIMNANLIGNNSTAAIVSKDKKAAQRNLSVLAADSRIIQAIILTKQGDIFANYANPNNNGEAISIHTLHDLFPNFDQNL